MERIEEIEKELGEHYGEEIGKKGDYLFDLLKEWKRLTGREVL